MKLAYYLLKGIDHLVKYNVLSFPITLILLIFYFKGAGAPNNFLAWVYAISIPSYYFMIILLLTLLLSPLYFIHYTKYFVIIPKVLIDIYLLVNLFIFNTYRFHIDTIIIYMLIHDFNGMGISPYIVILVIMSFAVIFFINLFAFVKAVQLKKSPAIITSVIILLFIAGQLLHIWGYKFNQGYIIRYSQNYPCYFPVKADKFINRMAQNYPKIVPEYSDVQGSNIISSLDNDCVFHYPLRKLKLQNPSGEKPNIIFFVLESWRTDMMNGQITPKIYEFSKKSYVFTNHMSGGNCTPTGLFSLMYGLHATYLKYVESNPMGYPPVLRVPLIILLVQRRYKVH